MAEVRRLLQDAEAAAALCKPWLLKPGLDFLRSRFAEARQLVDLADTVSPGRDRKPALNGLLASGWEPVSLDAKLPKCSGCGQPSLQLRKCSACKVVACEMGGHVSWVDGSAVGKDNKQVLLCKHCECITRVVKTCSHLHVFLQTARETAR